MKITVRHVHEFGPGASSVLGLLADRLHSIIHQGNMIMSKFSEFAAAQKSYNDAQSAAWDKTSTAVSDIAADVKSLNDKIAALQNSNGEISQEDQALLDGLQADGQALATKANGVVDAITAVDDLTPPVVPVEPPAQ